MAQLVELHAQSHEFAPMHTCYPNILQKDQEFKVSVRDIVSLRSTWPACINPCFTLGIGWIMMLRA